MARVGPIPRYPLMAQFLLKATKEKSPYIHVYIERFICLALIPGRFAKLRCKDSSAETSIPKVLSSLRAHCACHCASAIEIPRTHWLHRLSLKLPSGQKKQHDQLKQSRPTHPQLKKSRTKQHSQLQKSRPKTNPYCHARSTNQFLVLLLLLVPTKAKEW